MKALLLTSLVILSNSLWAGECVLTIQREACYGKKEEILKTHGGKNPSIETQVFESKEDCLKFAKDTSLIPEKGLVSSKHVTAKFDGP